MKRILVAAVAAIATLSLASCGQEKAPESCITALNQADMILKSTSKAAQAVLDGDRTAFDDAMSDVRVTTPLYRANNEKCHSLQG